MGTIYTRFEDGNESVNRIVVNPDSTYMLRGLYVLLWIWTRVRIPLCALPGISSRFIYFVCTYGHIVMEASSLCIEYIRKSNHLQAGTAENQDKSSPCCAVDGYRMWKVRNRKRSYNFILYFQVVDDVAATATFDFCFEPQRNSLSCGWIGWFVSIGWQVRSSLSVDPKVEIYIEIFVRYFSPTRRRWS
jgi:hypothetical protein